MAIEILENTLLKLLVRRGTNSDRQQIILQSGELGYTTDTERLYIGNSTTGGGIIVGNKYKGSTATITSLVGIVTGDYAYDTTNRTLKVCARGTGAEADDWITVSNYTSAGDATLNIDSQGLITVGTSPGGGLSASNIDWDAVGKSITLDDSLRVTLSSTISIDRILRKTTGVNNFLGLPRKLDIAGINYILPEVQPVNGEYLGRTGQDDAGNADLQWSAPGLVLAAVAPTTASAIPVGTVVPYASAGGTLPWGWLLCNGQAVSRYTYTDLLSVIGINYGAGNGTTTFNIPNLTNKLLYSNNNPATSTLFGVTTGASTTHGSVLSATGMQFIIKSIGGVTSPTMTVGKNLAAFVSGVDKTDITFDPLSGKIVIERPPPGQQVFREHGSVALRTFTMPAGISYVKYYVTGSGARAHDTPGGAAATCIGYISAAPGTEFILKIAEARAPDSSSLNGDTSKIFTPGGSDIPLVTSNQGIYYWGANGGSTHNTNLKRAGAPSPDGDTNSVGNGTGFIAKDSPYILNGEVILGGSGGQPSYGGYWATGCASYWGSVPAPGAGQNGYGGSGAGWGHLPTTGIIMFEWN